MDDIATKVVSRHTIDDERSEHRAQLVNAAHDKTCEHQCGPATGVAGSCLCYRADGLGRFFWHVRGNPQYDAAMCDLPPEAYEDCFHPPSVPTQVFCLHCQEIYDSYLIEWREEKTPRGRQGFWRCPTPGCSGAGFGFDIHPIDPDYIDPDGRDMGVCFDDDDGYDEWDEDDCDALDELIADAAADDIGLEPVFAGPADEQPPIEIPMDDLMPVNEEVGTFDLSPDEMDEIERKIGWRQGERGGRNS